MDNQTALSILSRVQAAREKQAEHPFAEAVQNMAGQQLRSDALGDVGNLGLAALGIGAGTRGALGLYEMLRDRSGLNTRSGPAALPLPMPARVLPEGEEEDETKSAGVLDFLSGGSASTKAGIPWYGPAMMATGMAGLGAGWKGVDMLLDSRRQRERDEELEKARTNFRDALTMQYAEPQKTKKAADTTMEMVGQELDILFEQFSALQKKADLADLGGAATGMYGMYAGLSGLLAGSLVYSKMRKRSRSAVTNKAMQRRERRKFNQQPPEIYAVPEPIAAVDQAEDRLGKMAYDNVYLRAIRTPLSFAS